MVIEKILKVNSADPKAEELRQRLAALQAQGKPQQSISVETVQQTPVTVVSVGASAPSTAQGAQAAQSPSAPQPVRAVSRMDAEIQQLKDASIDDKKRYVERKDPGVRLQEERTLALVMVQLQEITTVISEQNKKQRDADAKVMQLEKSLESFKDKHEELFQKMNGIDSRLEKFMGLYELITNQYNPFAGGGGPGPFPQQTRSPLVMPQVQQLIPAPISTQPTSPVQEVAAVQAEPNHSNSTWQQSAQIQRPAEPQPNLKPQSASPALPSAPPTSQQQPPPAQTPVPQPTPAQPPAPQIAPAQFAVEDSLTHESATVTIKHEDSVAAQARFKRVEELLADLQKSHAAAPVANVLSPVEQVPVALTTELHAMLAGFESRLTQQLDAALQAQLHERFGSLEGRLQNEIRDALRDEIEAVQHEDREVNQALAELQALVQAREGRERNALERNALEEELAALQKQMGSVRDDIKAISPELYFRLADGHVLRDLKDLRDALETMPVDLFNKHVMQGRNDFATWVENAIAMPELANLMRQAWTPQDMRKRIVLHDGEND